jgi:hypothetical protein
VGGLGSTASRSGTASGSTAATVDTSSSTTLSATGSRLGFPTVFGLLALACGGLFLLVSRRPAKSGRHRL